MTTLLRIVVAIILMLAAAAIVYVASRGHVFFLPFILILGLPLAFLPRRRS